MAAWNERRGTLALAIVVVCGCLAGCSTGSEPEADQFSGGGIDLTCDSAEGVRFDVGPNSVGVETPEAALDGIRVLLEGSDSDIALPDGDFVGTGLSSGTNAKFTLIVDGRTAATVDLTNPGRGWLINGVTVCS